MRIARIAAAVGMGLLAAAAGWAALAGEAPAPKPADKAAGLIVFSSNRSGPWHLWSIRPDGSGLKEITKGGTDEHDADPCLSHDGQTILFSSTRSGTVGIWKTPLDGSKLERLCDGDQAEWSPDGKRIAFRRTEKGPTEKASTEKIFIRDLVGGQEKCITPADWPHCSGPAWSPDGKTIAFACRWDAGNALFTVPVDGGKPTKVYGEQGACEPHWSPDGLRLVYETEAHICTISPDGKQNRLVTTFGGVQRYGRFSPDGGSIVFCQGASERGPWELYIIPAQGGTPRQLTEDGSDLNPDWR